MGPCISDWNAVADHRDTAPYIVTEADGESLFRDYRQQLHNFVSGQSSLSFANELPWLHAIADTLRTGRITFYLVHRNERLVALVPLEKESMSILTFKLRTLQFPSDTNIYLNDFLVDEREAPESVISEVLKFTRKSGFRWHYCRLAKYAASSHTYTDLLDCGGLTRRTGGSSWIACETQADIEKLSRKAMKNVSRLTRKAQRELGDVTLHESNPERDQPAAFREFLNIEKSGWKGVNGTATSVADDELANQFFSRLFLDFGLDWNARVFTLKCGDVAVASALAVYAGSTWHLLKIGYEERFKQYGPGAILLKTLLVKMCDDSLVSRVSLVTSPVWAERWHFDEMPVYETILFSKTLSGQLSKLYFFVRTSLARTWKELALGRKEKNA